MTASAGTVASVLERADELALETEVPGEITRPYGSPSLVRALAAVERWLAEAGLRCRRDAIGNVIGRRGGAGPAFVLGSHVDSVRNAGRYDGPLGVLVAIAALERLRESELAMPIEVVAFADEEGLRYRASYLASRAVAGLLTAGELATTDDDGVALADAVRATGGDPQALAKAVWRQQDLLGYLEVHIEQGPVLEDEDLPVGIVTGIAGQSRGFVELAGVAGHAGNTPPGLRRDALCGAAELVLAVERTMHGIPGLRATVGVIENQPNVGNVIPGSVTVSYDVRHRDDTLKEAAVGALRETAADICSRRRLELDWRHLQRHAAVPMSDRLRELLGRAVAATGVRPFELPSGAGHDAVSIAHLADVAMLFVRCRSGMSHHPDESVREDDVAVAMDVVVEALRRFEDA